MSKNDLSDDLYLTLSEDERLQFEKIIARKIKPTYRRKIDTIRLREPFKCFRCNQLFLSLFEVLDCKDHENEKPI